MVTKTLEPIGGIETHVAASLPILRAKGYEVLTIGEKGEVPIAGLGDFEIPAGSLSQLGDALADFRPDVVHTHAVHSAASVFGQAPGSASTVMSIHAYTGCMTGMKYFGEGEPCLRALGPGCFSNMVFRGCSHRKVPRPSLTRYRVSARQVKAAQDADACVVYSRHMREHMMRNGVVDPKVVPLFTEAGEVPSPPPGNRVILFVGRVVNYKGLEVAVEALAEVPDAYLWILGDGWEMPKVTAEVERLGIADRVRRIGWTAPQDLPTLYQKADVVVVPSRWPEPFGMVGIEAMAQGRAVIASDSGGMRDWLVPDETGWFFKPGSATELATRLRVALDDPGRLEEMGSTGRARVIERFSPEAFGREIGGVYGGATR